MTLAGTDKRFGSPFGPIRLASATEWKRAYLLAARSVFEPCSADEARGVSTVWAAKPDGNGSCLLGFPERLMEFADRAKRILDLREQRKREKKKGG